MNERGSTEVIEDDLFKYRLDLSNFTAEMIIRHREIFQEELIIPRSINYNNAEFVVTSLDEKTIEYGHIRNIIFPEDSEVRFIHNDALYTYFETIKLPPLLQKINNRSLDGPLSFDRIFLWPNSRYITKLNDQLLLEKSDIDSNVFDVIVLANPNIETITIPDYATIISENAFASCYNMSEINFSENSHLRTIEQNAFLGLPIVTITIPSSVKNISSYAFCDCRYLRTVNFAPNSELCSLSTSMFHGCSIENFTIPCNVKDFQPEWHDGIKIDSSNISVSHENHNLLFLNNKIILGKTNQNSDNYDVVLFACSDVEEENIPDYVIQIGPFAFSKCKRLRTIHFSANSQLSFIGEGAFEQSFLQTITIPSHVQEISKRAFSKCNNLTIDFAPNSELRSFNSEALFGTSIRSLFIPTNIENIYKNLMELSNIGQILISPENHNFRVLNNHIILGKSNSNSNDFDVIIFALNDCVDENIPDNIKQIGPYAFSKCRRLRRVIFSANSQLSIIDSHAFFESSLNEITIPKNVTEIRKRAFSRCKSLNSFQFAPDSNLRIIGESVFISSSITSITIPSSVRQIQTNAFTDCNLQTIIFPEDSQLQQVGNDLFYSTTIQNAIIPPHLSGIIHTNH